MPGQALIQIAGRKRVYVYPNSAPFITPEQLEDIAMFDVEVDLPYAPWYDIACQGVRLEPGQMLNWPLNAPHRVENLDSFNISMTVSYTNDEIRRAEIVNLANGLFGIASATSRRAATCAVHPSSPRAVMQKLMRDSGWVKRERARAARSTFGSMPRSPARSST